MGGILRAGMSARSDLDFFRFRHAFRFCEAASVAVRAPAPAAADRIVVRVVAGDVDQAVGLERAEPTTNGALVHLELAGHPTLRRVGGLTAGAVGGEQLGERGASRAAAPRDGGDEPGELGTPAVSSGVIAHCVR